MSPEAIAHHESGHAVAAVLAFTNAAWLPRPMPSVRVRSVEIREDAPGQWSGNCVATNVYSTGWPKQYRIAKPFRDLMERQIIIHYAGGVSESIYRGESRRHAVLAFAKENCAADVDLQRAAAVIADLNKLTGRHFGEQHFAERTLATMLTHWKAVTALASALVEKRRIEDVEKIIGFGPIQRHVALDRSQSFDPRGREL
jgi:hypothetical protein